MDLLLIDNSNIFIEVQNHIGKDGRFDYKKFVRNHTNFDNQKKILVGSTPPKSDTFWSTMRNKGFEVFTYERTKSGEKSVDTRIVAEGVEFITNQKESGTLVLMSGDLDMSVLVEKAYERGWDIILWSWKDSLNNEYVNGDLSSHVIVKYLDDIQDNLVFFDMEFDGIYQKEYLGNRKKRLEKEERVKRFSQAKENALNNILNLNHLDDKDKYLNQIHSLTDVKQVSEIDNILLSAESENKNNKIEWERQTEIERIETQENKKLARKEFFENKLNWVVGAAIVIGGFMLTVKNKK